MRNFTWFNLALLVGFTFLIGCAGNMQENEKKLRQVELGMSKKEIFSIYEEAIPRGAKQYPNGKVEVLEIKAEYFSPNAKGSDPWTGMATEPQIWFYFYNGKLIQFGQPNDWPKDPDKIIEIRNR
jgi:hypothetical protein